MLKPLVSLSKTKWTQNVEKSSQGEKLGYFFVVVAERQGCTLCGTQEHGWVSSFAISFLPCRQHTQKFIPSPSTHRSEIPQHLPKMSCWHTACCPHPARRGAQEAAAWQSTTSSPLGSSLFGASQGRASRSTRLTSGLMCAHAWRGRKRKAGTRYMSTLFSHLCPRCPMHMSN